MTLPAGTSSCTELSSDDSLSDFGVHVPCNASSHAMPGVLSISFCRSAQFTRLPIRSCLSIIVVFCRQVGVCFFLSLWLYRCGYHVCMYVYLSLVYHPLYRYHALVSKKHLGWVTRQEDKNIYIIRLQHTSLIPLLNFFE